MTKHVLRPLQCGSPYQVFITAFNRIGSGLPSDILKARTLGNLPQGPKKDTVFLSNHNHTHSSPTTISLNLDQWRDNGCPILRYMIEYKHAGERSWMRIPAQLNVIKSNFKIFYFIQKF